jgi:hypothetical protein
MSIVSFLENPSTDSILVRSRNIQRKEREYFCVKQGNEAIGVARQTREKIHH